MTYLMIGGALVFAAGMMWLRLMWVRRRVSKKAHADYARSRGTLHARQLHAGIADTEMTLRPLIVERERIAASLDALARSELNELRQALASALVNNVLPDIRGVGTRLKDRIVESCFDGTLESLLDVQTVSGVGSEMAQDIQRWVQGLQNRIPQLLKADFEGKAQIRERFDVERSSLKTKHSQIERAIRQKTDVLAQAKLKLATLETATPAVYRRALLGDSQAAERVAAHTLGVYPEWEVAPKWFSVLVDETECETNGR